MSSNYLFTGSRCFQWSNVAAIDLFKTADSAEITFGLLENFQRIALSEDETEQVREWAALSMEEAAVTRKADLLDARCALQENLQRAKRLNRSAARKRKTSSDQAVPAPAIDINIWKRQRAEPELPTAA